MVRSLDIYNSSKAIMNFIALIIFSNASSFVFPISEISKRSENLDGSLQSSIQNYQIKDTSLGMFFHQ